MNKLLLRTTLPAVSLLGFSLLAVPATAQPLIPIFDAPSGMFLGASQGKKWLDSPKSIALMPRKSVAIAFFDTRKQLALGNATFPQSNGAPCEETLFSTFEPRAVNAAQFALGRSATRPMPRSIRIENPQSRVYRGIVTSILRENGLGSPAHIQQIWRVDLEGDGTQEVLLSATRKADYGDPNRISADARAGDYSILLLRKIVRGQVRNILVEKSFHRRDTQFSAPSFYRLAAVFDANGDGKMEILARGEYYEGGWTSLYELQNGAPKEVLAIGCGA